MKPSVVCYQPMPPIPFQNDVEKGGRFTGIEDAFQRLQDDADQKWWTKEHAQALKGLVCRVNQFYRELEVAPSSEREQFQNICELKRKIELLDRQQQSCWNGICCRGIRLNLGLILCIFGILGVVVGVNIALSGEK